MVMQQKGEQGSVASPYFLFPLIRLFADCPRLRNVVGLERVAG